jgi:hypothetical protein
MTPYYTDAAHNITLYRDDVLRLVPLLKAFDALPVQTMTVADPPYNVGMNYGPEVDDRREPDVYMNWTMNWFDAVPAPLVVTPGFVNMEMWMSFIGWPTAMVPWVKPNQSKKPFGSFQWFNVWEPVLFYGKPPANPRQDAIITNIGQQTDVKRRRLGGQLENRHPCPKYLPFWVKLIGNIWKPGWTIFDPFIGSGTTAMVCKRLGIPFIGADVKSEYLDLTIERLQQEVFDLPDLEVDDTVNYRLEQQRLGLENGHVAEEEEVTV